MKNYILFTTNDSRAIDNVSMTIETEMDSQEAIRTLIKSCKYSSVTVSPIGKPLDRAISFDDAIGEVKNIRLHKKTRIVDRKKLDIVISCDGIPGVYICYDRGAVSLKLETSFVAESPACLIKEHNKITRLIKIFGDKHLAYHTNRAEFVLMPYSTEETGVEWVIVKGDLVKITKTYSYIEEEL